MKKSEIAELIDHTTLGPESSEKDVEKVCREAEEYGFAAVCIEPIYVKLAKELLEGTGVKVDTVIGFPHGTHKPGAKGFEAQLAIEDGAEELDMVVNVPALIRGDYEEVARDITAVTEAARGSTREVIVKVILEMGLLDEEKKRAGCVISQASGADFVKTSTGFGPTGATVEDVELMRNAVTEEIGVKAAGGIGDYEAAMEMVKAGATRLGASSGVEIVQGAPED
ncbi:MAG: deoxyribose-phosphate aldolase [Candidatus Bipolaricaulia bacterium]